MMTKRMDFGLQQRQRGATMSHPKTMVHHHLLMRPLADLFQLVEKLVTNIYLRLVERT